MGQGPQSSSLNVIAGDQECQREFWVLVPSYLLLQLDVRMWWSWEKALDVLWLGQLDWIDKSLSYTSPKFVPLVLKGLWTIFVPRNRAFTPAVEELWLLPSLKRPIIKHTFLQFTVCGLWISFFLFVRQEPESLQPWVPLVAVQFCQNPASPSLLCPSPKPIKSWERPCHSPNHV